MQINYFHPLTFGMTVPLFTEKFYRVKGRFSQQNSTFDHLILLQPKSRKIIPNVALEPAETLPSRARAPPILKEATDGPGDKSDQDGERKYEHQRLDNEKPFTESYKQEHC